MPNGMTDAVRSAEVENGADGAFILFRFPNCRGSPFPVVCRTEILP